MYFSNLQTKVLKKIETLIYNKTIFLDLTHYKNNLNINWFAF